VDVIIGTSSYARNIERLLREMELRWPFERPKSWCKFGSNFRVLFRNSLSASRRLLESIQIR